MRFTHTFAPLVSSLSWLALICVMCTLWLPTANASDKILVVAGHDVSSKLERDVASALEDIGSVMDSAGYVGNLRARNQAPDSDSALTKLAPQMGATLIVVLDASRGKLEVTFRNGHTGAVIGDESFPARGRSPKLAAGAKHKLATAAKRAMSRVGPAPSASASESRAAAPVAQPAPARAQRAPAQPSPSAQQAEEEEEEEDDGGSAADSDAEADDASEDADPSTPQDKAASSEIATHFVISAAGGVGSREVLVPGRGGGRGLGTTLAPALDVGLGLEVDLSRQWLLRLGANYRTIFGMTVSEALANGATQQSTLSSHSLTAGASLGYLTEGLGSLGIHLMLGWGYRSLGSAAEAGLPNTSVSGPVIRPELDIAIGEGLATLRIAPELMVIVSQKAEVAINVAGLSSPGIAYGGEVSFDFHLGRVVGLGVMFRESRGVTSSSWGYSATENERYILGRVTLTP
jgi:hypothetical protein